MVLNSRFISLAALCTLVTVSFPSTVHAAAASVHHHDSNIKARDGSQPTDHVYLRSVYPGVKYKHNRTDRRGRNNKHDEKSAQETKGGNKGTEHLNKQGYVVGPNKRHSTWKTDHDHEHARDQPDEKGKNYRVYSRSRIHIRSHVYGQKKGSDQHIHEHVHDHVREYRRSKGEQSHPHDNGSLFLHGSGGTSYVIQSSTHHRRQYFAPDSEASEYGRDEDQRVPGTVDIMANSTSTGQQQHLGSLVIEKSTNSTNNTSFSLNASNTNQTQFYLVALSNNVSNADTSSNGSTIVKLELDVYDRLKAKLVSYCATFDPKPSKAQALMMEPCSNGFGSEEHTSQLFTYNTYTGVVVPMWGYAFNGTNTTGSHPNSTSSAGPVPSASSNSSVANAEADSTFDDTTTRGPPVSRDSSSAQSLNVILVFTPAAPQVTPSVNAPSPAPPNHAGAANETEATTTITTQVTTTATASTVGPSPNAMDAATSTSGTNTSTSAPISSTTAAVSGSLDVEWIAAPTNTSSSTTSTSYATSMNAEAVASSIANSGSASTTKTASISTSTTMATAVSTSSESSTPSSPAMARAASYQWKFKAEREYER